MSEKREIPTACLGCLLELPRYWLKWHRRGAGWSCLREVPAGAASGRCRLELGWNCLREVPAGAASGRCWLELPPRRGAGWNCLKKVPAGAASERCWLELYRDTSCLIGEAPKSRKEVSKLANCLGSTV